MYSNINVIVFNFSWMSFNVFLAIVAVVFGWLFLNSKNKILKGIYGVMWLLFVPNTIYLFTDLINLMSQWGRYNNFERIIFLFQYGTLEVICVATSVLSLYQFEKFVSSSQKIKKLMSVDQAIFLFNFIIGFGITLGRVQRINSWEVFTAPFKVLDAGLGIINSSGLMTLTILFSLFSSFLYFLFRKPVLNFINIYLSRVAV